MTVQVVVVVVGGGSSQIFPMRDFQAENAALCGNKRFRSGPPFVLLS